MRNYLMLLLIFLTIISCSKEEPTGPGEIEPGPTELLERLQALPGIEVIEITPEYFYTRAFQIDITQPLDHNSSAGQTFTQRVYLSHIDESAPMVFAPSGYSVSTRSFQEIADILQSNLVTVTHRFMEGAEPQSMEWQYLTVEQAAADHHRIVEMLQNIYSGAWISSGASKSGLTALYHRRFYPDDVQATIALAAPIMFSTTDSRFEYYLKEIAGDETCRNKIIQFQKSILENKLSILPLVISHLDAMGLGYSLGEEMILEFAVLEYPFYFWSVGPGDCNVIPDTSAPASVLLSHLLEIISLYEYTEAGNNYFRPVYYQLFTEIGYYGLITDHLHDLLEAVTNPTHKTFAPNHNSITYKPEVMQDINNWLQTSGNNIIYIYGSQDSWTAAAIELTGGT
ncbi:MAG: S28 family serine protease, partial [Ignavibacteriaceae bacterium]